MAGYADLEIALTRWDAECYRVEVRFSQPDSDVDIRLAPGSTSVTRFDQNSLLARALDPAAYGKLLSQYLFADEALRTALAQARTSTESTDASLRLRLAIDSTAPELHALRWETLCDPQTGTSLVTSERVLFTRYLSSQDWRRVKLRSQRDLRALACIANPSNLADYKLAPVDVAG